MGSLPPMVVGVMVGVGVGDAVGVIVGVDVGVNVGVIDGVGVGTGGGVCVRGDCVLVGDAMGVEVQAVIKNNANKKQKYLFILTSPFTT